MRYIKSVLLFLTIISINACETMPEKYATTTTKQETATQDMKNGRTLILEGNELRENEHAKFTSWKCSDYSSEEKTLVEFGQISVSDEFKSSVKSEKIDSSKKGMVDEFIKKMGFVLYEGTNAGDFTLYNLRGLNHQWNWGPEGKYSFIIKPDGTGLFYDFTSAEAGESIKANDVYKCRKY